MIEAYEAIIAAAKELSRATSDHLILIQNNPATDPQELKRLLRVAVRAESLALHVQDVMEDR